MDIVKAFEAAGLERGVTINIHGTHDAPLFQASQIGKLLGLKNIRETIKHFDDDEKGVSLTYTLGGPQTTIVLTEVGLYRLLGMSRKPIAYPFQKWVGCVIREIRQTGKYEADKELESYKTQLARLADENASLQAKQAERMKRLFEHGDAVYLVVNTIVGKYVKVGECEDLNNRGKSYRCHDPHSAFVHHVMCKNRKLLESVVHHVLRAHAAFGKRDTFELPVDVVKEVLDSLHRLLDGAAANVQYAREAGMRDRINAIVDDMDRLAAEAKREPTGPYGAATMQSPGDDGAACETAAMEGDEGCLDGSDVAADDFSSEETAADPDVATGSGDRRLTPPNDPRDYAKFFQECFDRDPAAQTSIVDVRARHTLWCRSTATESHAGLSEYLAAHQGYRRSDVEYDPVAKVSRVVVRGIAMRPMRQLTADDVDCSKDFERFFLQRCQLRATGRVSCRDLRTEFVRWKSAEVDPQYAAVSPGDRRDFKARMDASGLYSVISVGGRTRGGYYGVALVDHATSASGTKRKDGNRKAVDELCPLTCRVIRTFVSQTEAANDVGVSMGAVSTAISGFRTIRGRLFRTV